MPAFRFEAVDAAGKSQTGVLEADTARAVRSQLRSRGLVPLEVGAVEASPQGGTGQGFGRRVFQGAELTVWTRQLAGLVSAGLPLERALTALTDEAEQPRQRELVARLRSEVNAGHSFAQALSTAPREFDEVYRAVVGAGEQGGALGQVLEKLADDREERQALKILEAKANAVMLFVAGSRGTLVADVRLRVVSASDATRGLEIVADGPVCVLQLPAGSWDIEARHGETVRARTALLLRSLHPVVTGAVPAALDRRGVKAGAAVHGSGPAAMADVVVRAHAALVPGGILADAGRRPLGKNHPAGLLDQPVRHVLVGVDPLDVQRVCVLAHGNVERAADAGQMHVDLHLRGMLGLGGGNTLGDQIGEALD